MNEKIKIVNENSIERKYKNDHPKYEYYKREVTKRDEFNQCYICIYDILPLKSAYPLHYHENNTEAFYIIKGEGKIITEAGERKIGVGDIIIFPPKKQGSHKIINTSEKDILSYIDFDTTNSPDVIDYPNSNKIGVVIHNKYSKFYNEDSNTDYYDGE